MTPAKKAALQTDESARNGPKPNTWPTRQTPCFAKPLLLGVARAGGSNRVRTCQPSSASPMLSAHELLHLTVTFCSLFNWSRYLVALTSQSMEGGLAFRGLGAASAPAADVTSRACAAK